MTTTATDTLARDLYGLLTGDEDARVCKDISDAACNDQPRNYVLQLAALSATKIADHLADAKLVLPWLLAALGAPLFLVGWLVPLREALSLLPQLAVAAQMRRVALRKWFWVGGSLVEAAAVAAMAVVALAMHGAPAGWTVLALLVVFSLARGVCSVAAKDVLGKTVARTKRGSVSGYAASIAGIAALAVGLYAQLGDGAGQDTAFLAALLAGAALLWVAGALTYAQLLEVPGATTGGGNALAVAVDNLRLLARDARLRHFLYARALLVSTALVAPFYAALAHETTSGELAALGVLIVASGLASILSGPVWGRLSDRSSRLVLSVAGLGAALLGFATVALRELGVAASTSVHFYAVIIFALGIAHAGVRIGRKTYLVDMATEETRAAYVAVSNTIIGVILFATGAVGAVTYTLGAGGAIIVLSAFALAGAICAWRLPELE
ncbi:MAG: MFS transporter [Gammaproteobacteria bacterium]|nr:MFS transporter [Gammaproteobacteria bacterium]